MANYARKGMTSILKAFICFSIVGLACGTPISQVGETKELRPRETKGVDSREDCLDNQFLRNDQTCQNCTYCFPGTEHSPSGEQCGNGYGVNTTCVTCQKGQYQTREGYSGVKCDTCVTCTNAEVLKECKPTQNAECGDCFPGMYELAENTCIKCIHDPSRPECNQNTPDPIIDPASGTEPPSTQQAPTHLAPTPPAPTPSSDLTPEPGTVGPPVSTPSSNATKDYGDQGTPTTKFSWREGVFFAVGLVIICVLILSGLAFKKYCKRGNVQFIHLAPAQLSGKTPPFPKVAFEAVLSDGESGVQLQLPDSERRSPNDANGSLELRPESQVPSGVIPVPQPATPTPVTAPAPPVDEPLQGAGAPADPPLDPQSSDVTNKEVHVSLPGPLRSNGGPGGDHAVYLYQHGSLELQQDSPADYLYEGPAAAASAATAAADDDDVYAADQDAEAADDQEDDSSELFSQPLPLMP